MPEMGYADRSLVSDAGTDDREQLQNAGLIGRSHEVQLCKEQITSLRGILFDLDPHLLRSGPFVAEIPDNPEELYQRVIRPWLQRDSVLSRAEVRASGSGLHVILRFANPVTLRSAYELERWVGVVEVVQCALPIDPRQPGITALTRPLGASNSKTGRTVTRIAEGGGLDPNDVLGLFQQMQSAPFRTVAGILLGADRVAPCPFCREPGSTLTALDHVGQCYVRCGKVQLSALYDLVFAAPEAGHDA